MALAWVDAIGEAELLEGDVTHVVVSGRDIAIYDTPNQLYASAAFCTHAGALLCDGYFDGYLIECPLHQGCFDIRTGEPKGAPVTRALKTYEVRVVEGMVQVKL